MKVDHPNFEIFISPFSNISVVITGNHSWYIGEPVAAAAK